MQPSGKRGGMPRDDDTLADYLLGRVIGRGANGTVHLASHRRDGTTVAVKLLAVDAGISDDERTEMRERFLAEARIAMRLRHPDIVAVLAAGETSGRFWQAMELASGCSLARYVQARYLLPLPVVLDIGARLAAALDYVHSMGVVHRDIKPSNVLVDITGGFVKLTDFGTARVLDNSRTRTGVMLGTPAYMPPEQLAGSPAVAAGDIYSLGVLVFELLTARRPHHASSMGDFLRRVASEQAPDIRLYLPDAPTQLAETLAQALSTDPAKRQSSAAIFSDSLSRARLHAS